MKRIKLIVPPDTYQGSRCPTISSSLPPLTAFLKKKGFFVEQDDLSVKIWYLNTYVNKLDLNMFCDLKRINSYLNLSTDNELELIIEEILNETKLDNYDFIGFSIMFESQFYISLCLAKKIKEICDCKIILGGPFFLYLDNKSINLCLKYADYIILGQGEKPFAELLKTSNIGELKKIPNLIQKGKKEKIEYNPDFYEDLNALPMPNYDDLIKVYMNVFKSLKKEKFYIKGLSLPYQITSGCIFNCAFCNHKTYGKSCFKSVNKVENEVKEISKKYGIFKFIFLENNLNISKDYFKSLCNSLEKLNIKWGSRAIPKNIDEELAKKLRISGCKMLSMGVETGSPRLLKYINKNINLNEVSEILKSLKKANVRTSVNFIFDLPYETIKDINLTIDFIKKNIENIYRLHFSFFTLKEGSPFYKYPEYYGIKIREKQKINYAFDELKGLKYEERGKYLVDLKEFLMKNFKKYQKKSIFNF